jgi:hypothetical protein
MNENKECAAYLGIYIAERALSKFFDNIIRMPMHNPGYDFLCGKGFKIDCKSACISIREKHSDSWKFMIRYNKTPDHFLCLAFQDRDSLEPKHVWLIPGSKINSKNSIRITEGSFSEWTKYERPIDRVIKCCNLMKVVA